MRLHRGPKRGRDRDERGVNLVEFALVFCLVVLPLLFGIIQYSYLYWSLETAAATAREAARRLAVGEEWLCVDGAPVTWDAEVRRQAGLPATGPVTVAPAGPAGYDPTAATLGSLVTVTVSFPTLDVGFLPVPGNGVVSETAEARVQNVPGVRAGAPSC